MGFSPGVSSLAFKPHDQNPTLFSGALKRSRMNAGARQKTLQLPQSTHLLQQISLLFTGFVLRFSRRHFASILAKRFTADMAMRPTALTSQHPSRIYDFSVIEEPSDSPYLRNHSLVILVLQVSLYQCNRLRATFQQNALLLGLCATSCRSKTANGRCSDGIRLEDPVFRGTPNKKSLIMKVKAESMLLRRSLTWVDPSYRKLPHSQYSKTTARPRERNIGKIVCAAQTTPVHYRPLSIA